MSGDATEVTPASAVNFRAGESIANALTVRIDTARQIKLYATVPADVVVDVVGYFVPASGAGEAPAGGRFTAITPVRVYDAAADPAGPLPAREAAVVSVATDQRGAREVVPQGASAVAYNITVVRPDGAGHLQVMPGDQVNSESSAINWTTRGDVVANGSIVKVDDERRIRVFNAAGVPVRFLVDVVGYYSDVGALFFPVEPARVLDTRRAHGGAGPIGSGEAHQRTGGVATALGTAIEQVPSGAMAVAYNLTVAGTGSGGHLRVSPAGTGVVSASTINWPGAGYSRANGSVVAVSAAREVTIYNGAGTPTEAIIDVFGYYK
ncbi:MAG: hypothetical protein QG597_4852, partial [Actinomycetota bacterium]|nr:hypothetical protein [Actinomycetota bacterium]